MSLSNVTLISFINNNAFHSLFLVPFKVKNGPTEEDYYTRRDYHSSSTTVTRQHPRYTPVYATQSPRVWYSRPPTQPPRPPQPTPDEEYEYDDDDDDDGYDRANDDDDDDDREVYITNQHPWQWLLNMFSSAYQTDRYPARRTTQYPGRTTYRGDFTTVDNYKVCKYLFNHMNFRCWR